MKEYPLTLRNPGAAARLVAFIVLHSCLILSARAQGTAFTYQGLLTSSASVAKGAFDFQFALHSAVSGPAQVGATISSNAVAVGNGLFTVKLDFGTNFPGADRWLEIGVRTNGGGAFTTLSPRQKITSAPYAIQSSNAASVSDGAITAAKLSVGVGANGQVLKMNGSVLGWGADNNNGGTVSGVTAGLGLSGGTITTSGTLTIDTAVVPQLNSPNIFSIGPQSIRLPGGGNQGLVIRGGAGQTASLQEWENNGATTLAAVSANGTFTGSGAGLTNLTVPATNLTGTLPDVRLSANVALLNGINLFSGTNTVAGVANLTNANNVLRGSFTGNGAGLTSLNPANLSVGNAAINISGNAATATIATNFSGALPVASGGTAATTASGARANLGAASLTTANTFSGVNALTNVANTVVGSFSGNGAGLTNLTTAANYLYTYDTTIQTVAVANTFQDITFDTDAQINGWTHTGGNASFTCNQTGLFLIQYAAETESTIAATSTVSLRAVLNGAEVAGSQSSLDLDTASQTMPVSKSFLVNAVPGNSLKLQFTGTSTNDRVVSSNGSGTTRPSASMTVIRIQ